METLNFLKKGKMIKFFEKREKVSKNGKKV